MARLRTIAHARAVASLLALWFILMPAASSAASAPSARISALPQQLAPPLAVTNWVVARISFTDTQDLNLLASRLDVWDVDHVQRVLVAPISRLEMEIMRQAGRTVSIDETLTRLAQEPPPKESGEEAAEPGRIPGFPCYRTVDELYQDMEALASAHPGLVSWQKIGESWDKTVPGGPQGKDLHALVITNKAKAGPKFRFFLLAAIHARELATTEVAARFAEQLIARYDSDPDVTWLLDYGELHVVVVANPDGRRFAEQRILWRKNTNSAVACSDENPHYSYYGVDLNRNSSFKWNQCHGSLCSSDFACDETYRGTGPASEPETQAIEAYVRSLFDDMRGAADGDAAPEETSGLFISLHSYGSEILFPWGWTDAPPPNLSGLQTLGRKFGFYTNYEVCQPGVPGCLYQTDGTTDDWAYGELGVAAYTFEVGTWFFEQCDYYQTWIEGPVLDALTYGFKAARLPYLSAAGPESLSPTPHQTIIDLGAPMTLTVTADDGRFSSGGFGMEPVQNVVGGRVAVDAPSWITGTQIVTLTVLDGSGDSPVEGLIGVVDTSGWNAGRHTLFVEAVDSDGNWGVPTALYVDVYDETIAFDVSPRFLAGEAFREQTETYQVTITNTGPLTDSYDLSFNGTKMRVEFSQNPVGPLAPGNNHTLTVSVTPYLFSRSGLVGRTHVFIKSSANPTKSARVVLKTTLREILLYLPVVGQRE